MRKKIWKIWQKFLPISAWIAVISIIIAGCCLDSESIVPMVVMGINLTWISILMIANDPARERKTRDKENKKNGDEDYEDIAI